MTVHVLTPVHNRCVVTESFISDLFNQDIDEDLRIVIVDDGSKDGTAEMLRARAQEAPPHITLSVINGDGSWWWARSMATAVSECRPHIDDDDVVVFMNDDVQLLAHTLRELLVATRSQMAIVTASVLDAEQRDVVLDRGAKLDARYLAVLPIRLDEHLDAFTKVDVAAGRAVAFPAAVFTSGINVNYRRLPHHLADFEFSVRAARCGFPILLARDIHVYSFNDFARTYSQNPIRRLFHISSPDRLSAYWAFWRTVSPSQSRARTLSKLLRYRILPQVLRSLRDLVALRTGTALECPGRP